MSQVKALLGQTSPGTGNKYGVGLILRAFWAPFSYDFLAAKNPKNHKKRGPKTKQSDKEIGQMAREALNDSSFSGEGHRKVGAMLAKKGVRVGKTRILRIMGEE